MYTPQKRALIRTKLFYCFLGGNLVTGISSIVITSGVVELADLVGCNCKPFGGPNAFIVDVHRLRRAPNAPNVASVLYARTADLSGIDGYTALVCYWRSVPPAMVDPLTAPLILGRDCFLRDPGMRKRAVDLGYRTTGLVDEILQYAPQV